MEIMYIVGSIISLLAYLPLIWIVKNNPNSHSWIAFLLYAMFDLIAGISIYNTNLETGSWLLMFAYVLGSLCISIIIFLRSTERVKIDNGEKIIMIFIIVCIALWFTAGNRVATISSNMIAILAGLFEAKKLWEKPDKRSSISWTIFLIGASLTFFAGQGWDLNSFIEQRLCPLTNALESILFIYLSGKK